MPFQIGCRGHWTWKFSRFYWMSFISHLRLGPQIRKVHWSRMRCSFLPPRVASWLVPQEQVSWGRNAVFASIENQDDQTRMPVRNGFRGFQNQVEQNGASQAPLAGYLSGRHRPPPLNAPAGPESDMFFRDIFLDSGRQPFPIAVGSLDLGQFCSEGAFEAEGLA